MQARAVPIGGDDPGGFECLDDVIEAARPLDGARGLAAWMDRPAGSGRTTKDSMNRFDRLFGLKGEARVRYLDGEYQVISPGDFVRCAVTGSLIALPDLRYWSVELQEAYVSAEVSLRRYLDVTYPRS